MASMPNPQRLYRPDRTITRAGAQACAHDASRYVPSMLKGKSVCTTCGAWQHTDWLTDPVRREMTDEQERSYAAGATVQLANEASQRRRAREDLNAYRCKDAAKKVEKKLNTEREAQGKETKPSKARANKIAQLERVLAVLQRLALLNLRHLIPDSLHNVTTAGAIEHLLTHDEYKYNPSTESLLGNAGVGRDNYEQRRDAVRALAAHPDRDHDEMATAVAQALTPKEDA